MLLERHRDYSAALGHARRLAHLEPLNEATYLTLMRLHALSGDRSGALRVYHTCATILQQELGALPGAALRSAYEQLIAVDTPAEQAPAAATPLVGRRAAWQRMQVVWQTAATGRPLLLLLAGEAGIGKTRLAEELLRWAARQGGITATAQCYSAEGRLAYAPVVAWLRADTLHPRLNQLNPAWLVELSRLDPELLTARRDLPSPGLLSDAWQRQRLFEALARAVLAVGRPTLLMIDDLQWCDRDTLEWLHYLLRFDHGARLLVVGAVRDAEFDGAHPLATLLEALRSEERTVEALLAESEVDAIVIATPHHLLAPAALAAIRAGKHVLAEKPIALSEREAVEVAAEVARTGVSYMAGYSFRYSMGRYVHELVAGGAVGEIRGITGAIGMGPLNDGWIAYPETGGGPLLYVGCHLVDLALWLLGDDPVEVFAHVQRRADTGADDTTTLQIRFAKGALAQFLVTQAASTFFYELGIHGGAGTIALRGRNFLQFEVEVSSTVLPTYGEPTVIRPSVRRDNITMMLVPELEAFAGAVYEQCQPAITVADGRQVLRILDAVSEAGQVGRPIALR